MDQKETKCQFYENRQFQHITYNVKYIFMLTSFFLQIINPANKNQYQASKNVFKVSNKITKKSAGEAACRCSLK